MKPILLRFVSEGGADVREAISGFDSALRGQGATPLKEWSFENSGYAVVEDPPPAAELRAAAVSSHIKVVGAAFLEAGGPAFAQALDSLPAGEVELPQRFSFNPMMSLPPQDDALVVCGKCRAGIHPPGPCPIL